MEVELMEEVRREQEVLLQEHKLWKELLDSAGWEQLRNVLTAQLQVAKRTVFEEEINSLDAAFRAANIRGRVAALQSALATPITALEEIEINLAITSQHITELQDD